jgi:hypothetical protein
MHSRYTFKKLSTLILLVLIPFLFSQCRAANEAADRLLFGVTESLGLATATEDPAVVPACTSDATVTSQTISLSEDGDVNATYDNTKDKSLNEVDVVADGTSWGYRSYETCVYLNTTFTGTVEIPVEINSSYAGRITTTHSWTAGAIAIATLPTKFTFTASGDTNATRECIKFTMVNDLARNPSESPLKVSLGKMIQKTAGGDVDSSGFYAGKDVCDVSVSLDDNEGPGIRVSNSNPMEEPPGVAPRLATTSFKVVLRQAPTANVTIGINDTYDSVNSGNRESTAAPTNLIFTTANWNTPQTVTVTSVDDLEVDGLKTYTIQTQNTVSTDTDYNGIKPRDVVIYNYDKSVPGYAFERFDATNGVTTTAGGTITGFATDENNQMGSTYANYKLKLRSKPTANVTLTFVKGCGIRCNLITTSITFTPSNWNVYQSVLVEGAPDVADSGNFDYTITSTITSTDPTYKTGGTVTPPVFSIRSCDNDNLHLIQPCNFSGQKFGIAGKGDPFIGAEPSATNGIWLITKTSPGSTVTVPLSSTDTTEGTVPANVTIDSGTYNRMVAAAANQIILTHVDDTIVDGSVNWTATTAAATTGLTYDTSDIEATTTDNENYYYVKVTGNTKEADAATTATIDVCLGADNPTAAVTLNIACTVASDECGNLSAASITFPIGSQVSLANASDAGCPNDAKRQSFTVEGFDDTFADGTQPFTITLTKVATADTGYTSAPNPGATPSINNLDNEAPGKAIFVSTSSYNGELGTSTGVKNTDSICNSTKPGFAPSGTYKAMMVSSSSGEVTRSCSWRYGLGINSRKLLLPM